MLLFGAILNLKGANGAIKGDKMARIKPLKGKNSEHLSKKIRNKQNKLIHSKMKSFLIACAIAVQASQAMKLCFNCEEQLETQNA